MVYFLLRRPYTKWVLRGKAKTFRLIHFRLLPQKKMTPANFTFVWPCIVTNFFIIKPNRCANFTNLFWHEILHVSGSSSAHHQEFIHCTFGTGMSYRFVDSFRAGLGWNCSSILVLLESCVYSVCMTYTIAECTVNRTLMMDSGTARNM
jgi:hypothetical protein